MRQADVSRNTSETKIQIVLNLDGTGKADLSSGVPFLDHMLDQIARHGMIDLKVHAKGDTQIDDHHTVEDVGITLGQAIAKAVGDKAGITRYGHSYVPLDETLSRVVIDFSGRPGLEFNVPFTRGPKMLTREWNRLDGLHAKPALGRYLRPPRPKKAEEWSVSRKQCNAWGY